MNKEQRRIVKAALESILVVEVYRIECALAIKDKHHTKLLGMLASVRAIVQLMYKEVIEDK